MTPEERAREVVDRLDKLFGVKSALSASLCQDLWDGVGREIRAAIAEEREACARIVENAPLNTVETYDGKTFVSFSQIAAAIRARR